MIIIAYLIIAFAICFFGMVLFSIFVPYKPDPEKVEMWAKQTTPSKYLHGHPNIDRPFEIVIVMNDDFEIHEFKINKTVKYLSNIKRKSIVNINVGDKSIIRGKDSKYEMAFLSIEWSDGKFTHNMITAYEGYGALPRSFGFAIRKQTVKDLYYPALSDL
jgi:hypothetical protein